jgi:CheY-like chemotaxis protein
MDSVGQLAGGIAHEANNMMSVVLGCADYVLQRSDIPDQVRQDVDQIWRAAKRTAGITQQLLAFSRRQMLQPQLLDLNAAVRELEPILNRALGETQGVKMHLSPTLGLVRADPGQLEQVLVNLTLNARDAMDEGGRLTIETMNVTLDAAYVGAKQVESLEAGDYAALVVTDTGHGMDQATLARIFEPFFTTKPRGVGTGLGLSTVFGIVKQSGGHIYVYSEPGRGTTVKVYLPRAAGMPMAAPEPHPEQRQEPGRETVLVVEDDASIRGLVQRVLVKRGYTVLVAASPAEAIALVGEQHRSIDLLLTDVMLPEMSGPELARILGATQTGLAVVYMSGYTDTTIVRGGQLDPGATFIPKPFGPEFLLRKVRDVLDAAPAHAPEAPQGRSEAG